LIDEDLELAFRFNNVELICGIGFQTAEIEEEMRNLMRPKAGRSRASEVLYCEPEEDSE
jgi:hypothetical protein